MIYNSKRRLLVLRHLIGVWLLSSQLFFYIVISDESLTTKLKLEQGILSSSGSDKSDSLKIKTWSKGEVNDETKHLNDRQEIEQTFETFETFKTFETFETEFSAKDLFDSLYQGEENYCQIEMENRRLRIKEICSKYKQIKIG